MEAQAVGVVVQGELDLPQLSKKCLEGHPPCTVDPCLYNILLFACQLLGYCPSLSGISSALLKFGVVEFLFPGPVVASCRTSGFT